MSNDFHKDFYREIDSSRHRPGCLMVLLITAIIFGVIAGAYYLAKYYGYL